MLTFSLDDAHEAGCEVGVLSRRAAPLELAVELLANLDHIKWIGELRVTPLRQIRRSASVRPFRRCRASGRLAPQWWTQALPGAGLQQLVGDNRRLALPGQAAPARPCRSSGFRSRMRCRMGAAMASLPPHAVAILPGASWRAVKLTVAALAFETPAMSRRSHSAIGRFGAEASEAVAIARAARKWTTAAARSCVGRTPQRRGTLALLLAAGRGATALAWTRAGRQWPADPPTTRWRQQLPSGASIAQSAGFVVAGRPHISTMPRTRRSFNQVPGPRHPQPRAQPHPAEFAAASCSQASCAAASLRTCA